MVLTRTTAVAVGNLIPARLVVHRKQSTRTLAVLLCAFVLSNDIIDSAHPVSVLLLHPTVSSTMTERRKFSVVVTGKCMHDTAVCCRNPTKSNTRR